MEEQEQGFHTNEIYDVLRGNEKRYTILYGGSGSGKSVAIAQMLCMRMMEWPNYDVLVMRKYGTDILDSVYKEIRSAIERAGYTNLFKFTLQPRKITFIPNGNEFTFRGLDDSEKLKSISGIKAVWMEEISEFEADDFMEANRRIRGDSDTPLQIFMSFNPVSESSWLKSTFFDTPNAFEEDMLQIHSTYRDNKWAGKDAAKVYKTMPEWQRRVYEFGEWGRVSAEGLYYGQFDIMRHVSDELAYNPQLPLYLSFDFNVLPSVTCMVTQQPDDKTIHLIDEIMLESPNNNTRYVCLEVMRKFKNHKGGVVVTGDATGKNGSSANEADFNNYTIIQKELAPLRPIMNNPSSNPAHIPRGQFINAVFDEEIFGLSIKVSRKCKTLLNDLNNQPQEPNGKKVKGAVTIKGKKMEKWGHASDAFDYQIIQLWKEWFGKFQRADKVVEYKFGPNELSDKYAF